MVYCLNQVLVKSAGWTTCVAPCCPVSWLAASSLTLLSYWSDVSHAQANFLNLGEKLGNTLHTGNRWHYLGQLAWHMVYCHSGNSKYWHAALCTMMQAMTQLSAFNKMMMQRFCYSSEMLIVRNINRWENSRQEELLCLHSTLSNNLNNHLANFQNAKV